MKIFGKPGLWGRFWRILPWIIGILCTLLLWQYIRTRRPLMAPATSLNQEKYIYLIF
ncbi:MAG: hypothetical protein RLZZ417_1896 [Bacteroidota bacterium]|jgi:hypothetical protein